jgi:diguanylate cyclase (GGDEF)-like protein/PAS domain S-box-containing protein
MTGFISRIARSISGKLITTVSLLVLLGCGVSWYALITSERNTLMKNAVDDTASYSDLIQKSIHYAMLSAHRESVQRVIENIGAQQNVKTIRIVDNQGRIVFSSRPAEITGNGRGESTGIPGSPPPGESLHGASASARRWKIHKDGTGEEFLAYTDLIYNEPDCMSAACHVHKKDEKILGMLQTDFSLQGVDNSIRRQALNTTVFAAVFLCVTSITIFFFVWRFVHKPVSLLAKNMKRIAGGDLHQRVPVTGEDEIGHLAGTFNQMAEELEKTTVSRDSLVAEIEERKKIEEKLQESEQFVNTAFDSIHDPFIIVDRDYRITRTNEAYSLMRNIPLQDLIGRKCYEVLHQKSDVCEDCTVSRTFLSLDPCASERSILQNGIETWYQVYTYPVLAADGKASHVIEYYRDITDRKVAERAARLAYAELDQIFNTAADGMCVIDKKFILQRVNKTFCAMFGMRGKTAIGSKCYELFPGPECHTSRCPLTLISSGQKVLLQYESEKVRTDGGRFPCIVVASAFRGHDGELMGIVEDVKDISERKHMEDELRNISLTDELTGLYNRRGFYALVEQELKMANRLGQGIYILYADLDRFKAINDTFGHIEGDNVLRDTARILQVTFRNSDIVARLGGDEFAVVPIGTKGDNVDTVVERLQKNLDLHNSGEGMKYTISVSVGLAYYDPEAPSSIDELLARADKCMYDNKRRRKSS